MTERSFGKELWYGTVVNVNDPDKEGRIQVRIFGLMDDTTNIPDSKLPWVKPCQNIDSAGQSKIGLTPVGVIPGSIIGGYYIDEDRQYPIFDHVIAKAGDPQSGTTTNGQETLEKGTNSTPIGERNKDNKFVIKKMNTFTTLDKALPEPKDSDGIDTTAEAIAKTKFATMPTIGSLVNPVEHVLQQLIQADPQHLTSVLPNAVEAMIKLKDLNTFSSAGGINDIIGQMLGTAMNSLGSMSNIISSIPIGQFSSQVQQMITTASQFLGTDTSNIASPVVQGIIDSYLPNFISQIQSMVSSGTISIPALETLLLNLFNEIQNTGTNATIGTTQSSVLQNLGSVLPQIAGLINNTLDIHLPLSVLNTGTITTALQKFAMSEAFLKHPENGKKVLATLATQKGLSSIGAIQGIFG